MAAVGVGSFDCHAGEPATESCSCISTHNQSLMQRHSALQPKPTAHTKSWGARQDDAVFKTGPGARQGEHRHSAEGGRGSRRPLSGESNGTSNNRQIKVRKKSFLAGLTRSPTFAHGQSSGKRQPLQQSVEAKIGAERSQSGIDLYERQVGGALLVSHV